ncbi:MAG: hypothetical protein ABFS56_31655, partial [Pseudomonadota bacterium]
MMANENQDNSYVHVPQGSRVIIVRDEKTTQSTEENSIDLRVYWHIFNKYRRTILKLTLAIGLLAILGTFRLTPIYQATTSLLI